MFISATKVIAKNKGSLIKEFQELYSTPYFSTATFTESTALHPFYGMMFDDRNVSSVGSVHVVFWNYNPWK